MQVTTPTKITERLFLMISVASIARERQRAVKKSYKVGVTRAALYYHVSRKTIYVWRNRYDGTWQSLLEQSRRPHHHPAEHTAAEKAMILKAYPYHSDDLIVLWDSLRKKGYTRSYYSMIRVIRKWIQPASKAAKRRKNKPYERASYPGQKVQVDVKYVPSSCVAGAEKLYQYTAVDECTRWTYRYMYNEHSTYSSTDFLKRLIEEFPVPIRMIQTDNGPEFTKALLSKDLSDKSLFEQTLEDMGILYHRIRVATPRHNGKVERQHREDQKRFYNKHKMYNLSDGLKQLLAYNKRSNDIPKIALDFRSPNEIMESYLGVM